MFLSIHNQRVVNFLKCQNILLNEQNCTKLDQLISSMFVFNLYLSTLSLKTFSMILTFAGVEWVVKVYWLVA